MAVDNLLGKTINGYEIIGIVGRGGMATVYKARQISMNRTVAMKVLPPQFVDDETYIQRFNREVNIVSQLEHRNIVPVYDYGEHERQPYIVMRYLTAGSIDELLQHGAIDLARVLEILRQVAPALDYAHSKNVLHRDLKPSNILLDDHGGAYITDFGIARILGESTGHTITTQGVVGTPSYMSPEQAQGKTLDGRSDIYSMGVMLFEMVTGRRPFESDTPYGIAVMQVTTPPPSPRSIKADIPVTVERVIYQALSKSPDQRYPTALALTTALQKALESNDTNQEETEPRIIVQQPAPISPPPLMPPPAAFYSSPTIAPPPNTSSSWVPVQKPRKRKRPRKSNIWMSLLVGSIIGCAMLVLLVTVAAVMLRRVDDIFQGGVTQPSIINVTEEVQPGIIATQTPNVTNESQGNVVTRIVPSNTPNPNATIQVQVLIITQTPNATLTPGVAPIGVRPEGDASN